MRPGLRCSITTWRPGAAAAVIAQRLVELLLARHVAGEIELAADPPLRLVERHGVPALGRGDGAGEARRSGTDDGDALGPSGRGGVELDLATGFRIDQAG